MKKGAFKNPVIDYIDESAPHERESPPLKPNNQQPSAAASQNLNSAGVDSVPDKRVIKQPKKQELVRPADTTQNKLASSIREIFLHMRRRTIDESPDCALILRKAVPFEEAEEKIMGSDPLILLQHIKKIFDKVLELKGEVEREAALRNENECGDYESMLQKLEAEVRQHIRIEQQLKLYVESVQSKLEEHEKEGDISKLANVQGEVENLKQENSGLNDKVKLCKDEISNLKKKMHRKVEMIEKLEKQLENIPVLKKMVKEMDRVLDGEPPTFSIQESVPMGSQRSSKEFENQGYLNTFGASDMKARKRSQPVVGSYSPDKNKESNEYIRIVDASMQFNEGPKRESLGGKGKSQKGSRDDGPSIKSTARLEEKVDELDDALKKHRRSVNKGESTRQGSREKQHPDQEGLAESNVKEGKAPANSKAREDMIEPSRFSYDPTFKAGMEEYLKKSLEKTENKSKTKASGSYAKKNKTHVLDNSKDKIDHNIKAPSRKNSASKGSRPGTTAERIRHHEHTQHSPEHHAAEPCRPKEVGSKRSGHDRSQSVETRKKLVRQHKSKASINEDEVEENYRKQVSFSGHYKAVAYGRVNQSGSGTFIKGHN